MLTKQKSTSLPPVLMSFVCPTSCVGLLFSLSWAEDVMAEVKQPMGPKTAMLTADKAAPMELYQEL